MYHRLRVPLLLKFAATLFFLFSLLTAPALLAQTPTPPADKTEPQPSADKSATPAAPPSEPSEVATHDTPTTFKVRVNVVLVRVLVRDAKGKIVTGLHKEDFHLTDNRKPQVVSSFAVETPESRAKAQTPAQANASLPEAAPATGTAKAAVLPQRFVALMFDDIHISTQDAVSVRDAATRLFGVLAPSDRVSISTTSGQTNLEFTDNIDAMKRTLLGISPRPTSTIEGMHDCPDVSYYLADQIVNKQDPQALAVATEDAVQCAFGGNENMAAAARSLAQGVAQRNLSAGDQESEYAFRHMEDAMKRLANKPGQRVMVFVSPGFIESTLFTEISDLIDRATHAGIVVNTIDARGLYTPDVLGDIADPPVDSLRTAGFKSSYRLQAQFAEGAVLGELADGTGGTFFHNRNDLDEGLREAVASPAMTYLLGFSPQNMKIDGRFHTLKVSMANKQKYEIQARKGYYAPKTIADPVEMAKLEIQEALFSQDELSDLPVEIQTQFFKQDPAAARLAVLTHLDVKGFHFRKANGRNNDDLTVATAVFDENGNFVTGGQKLLEMKLKDATYERLMRSGFTIKSSFDVKPGSYLVRTVVRDTEGAQMAAHNGAVVIPN